MFQGLLIDGADAVVDQRVTEQDGQDADPHVVVIVALNQPLPSSRSESSHKISSHYFRS